MLNNPASTNQSVIDMFSLLAFYNINPVLNPARFAAEKIYFINRRETTKSTKDLEFGDSLIDKVIL